VLQTKGGSISGLHSHLKTQHNINLLKREVFSEVNQVKQSAKTCPSGLITNYIQKNG